ncbi:hypothetical protein CLV98_1234 [Dyadobacter jejuensis]|uniref:Lipocalin-like protein n=1 Tax=Dyadobacter jejuensis TaxID=1082580 RepID=A0A316A699_9BACT|nr:hypothetical protein [Dyadobacter jejuensis]PWJ53391.1 hypothetical protein CLV98_1234 [Dyadobacter jejuensis]
MKYLIFLFLCSLISCSEYSKKRDVYFGRWKATKGDAHFRIYQENDGVFVHWSNGQIVPLTYQENGNYYNMSTVFGSMPLLISNDTLSFSQTKYVKFN